MRSIEKIWFFYTSLVKTIRNHIPPFFNWIHSIHCWAQRYLGRQSRSCSLSIEDVASIMKHKYEDAITSGGQEETHSLIRSKELIRTLHEFIKEKLVESGVHPSKIIPTLGETSPELKMIGFLKGKTQDISVLPAQPRKDKVRRGPLRGTEDGVSKKNMDKSITINVRSQLSSIGKNFDTLYERTFAEALNLHLRSPSLVLGEVYLVPLIGYDPNRMKRKEVAFSEPLPSFYVSAFQALNAREPDREGDEYKYERICLLILDFRKDPPELIESKESLVEEGIISEEEAEELSFDNLRIGDFVSDLLNVYEERHGSVKPLKSGGLEAYE